MVMAVVVNPFLFTLSLFVCLFDFVLLHFPFNQIESINISETAFVTIENKNYH